MIPRFLNLQGIAGLAASAALAILLILARGDARHWKKQSAGFEQLYRGEQAAFAGTVANYRAAAETARAADQANISRVAAEQRAINERTTDDFEARLATTRASAERLRRQTAVAATDRGGGGSAPMPSLAAAPAGIAQTPGEDRFSDSDALTATEQAIQLDELIKWVRAQAAVDPDPPR